MARRSNTAQAEPTTDATTEEAAVETPTTEPTEAPTEAKAEEVPVDLTGFQAAVNEALTETDSSTGEVPVASADKVNQAYRALDGLKPKNAARAWLDQAMKDAISVDKDIMRARALVDLKEGLSAGSGGGGTKAPADPTQAFVNKVASLRIAQTLVEGTVPEGVNEDWSAKVEELLTEVTGQIDSFAAFQASDDADAEEPEVSPVVRQAFKLAQGRGGGGGSRVSGGPRRDIEKHLVQVFENVEAGGFLTIAEIAKAQSTEYGDDRPSAGAVSARLFPKGKEPYSANGIEAVNEEGKSRGARKTA